MVVELVLVKLDSMMRSFSASTSPSLDVNDVSAVFVVSWEEKAVVLNEVFTEDESEGTP